MSGFSVIVFGKSRCLEGAERKVFDLATETPP
jgi:hypothetical protein